MQYNSIVHNLCVEGSLIASCQYGTLEIFTEKDNDAALNIRFSNGKTFRHFLRTFLDRKKLLSERKTWIQLLKTKEQTTKVTISQDIVIEGGGGNISLRYLPLVWQYLRYQFNF